MVRQGYGKIVNVASLNSFVGGQNAMPYSAYLTGAVIPVDGGYLCV